MQYWMLIPGVVCLTLFLRFRTRRQLRKALAWKTVTSLLFVALSFFAAASGQRWILFFAAGQVFGLLGDIFLDQKWMHPGEDLYYTRAGFLVFSLGHVAFATGMLLSSTPGEGTKALLTGLILGTLVAVFVLLLEKPLKMNYGILKMVVFFYSLILGTVTFMAISLFVQSGWASRRLLVLSIGLVLFLLSDLILSGTYFGEGKDRPIDIISNHVCYYAAQFMIAFSLFL